MDVKTQKSSRVHRFLDLIAIDFPDTETLYLTSGHAIRLRHILADYLDDIVKRSYGDSRLGVVEVKPE